MVTKEHVLRAAAHWERFLTRFGKPVNWSIFGTVLAHYAEMSRGYHAIIHIIRGLDVLEVARREIPASFSDQMDDAAKELAIWTHDIISDVHRRDNEERSAVLAKKYGNE